MDNGPKDKDAGRRIAELEQEVARLRDQVGDDVAYVDDGQPITAADMPYMPSQIRAIIIPILIGVSVFVGIIGLFALLSSGFDTFAKKAASALVPDDLAEQGEAPASARPPVKLAPINKEQTPQPPPIRAPGL